MESDSCTFGRVAVWSPAEKSKCDIVFEKISAEINRAYAKHGQAQWGRHEFYGIILEEVDEVWDDIKADAPTDQLEKEIIQVAAMCVRFLESGCKYSDPKIHKPNDDALSN